MLFRSISLTVRVRSRTASLLAALPLTMALLVGSAHAQTLRWASQGDM